MLRENSLDVQGFNLLITALEKCITRSLVAYETDVSCVRSIILVILIISIVSTLSILVSITGETGTTCRTGVTDGAEAGCSATAGSKRKTSPPRQSDLEGALDPADLQSFAYQIANGMVTMMTLLIAYMAGKRIPHTLLHQLLQHTTKHNTAYTHIYLCMHTQH